MLEAVSMMLDFNKEIYMNVPAERVECAKIMLDKIIEGMKPRETFFDIENKEIDVLPLPKAPNPPKQHIPPPIPDGQYQIEMNPDFTLRAINGTPPLSLDAPIELDGRVTTYKDVIGKAYNTIKIL